MFGLLSVIFVVFFILVVIGMVAHSVAFGSMVWLIAKKASDAAELQRPKPCPFCGSTLLPEATVCNACGAPRDAKHVTVGSAPENLAR